MKARILVVEDDVFIQEVIAAALVDAGYRVDLASNGLQAWSYLETGQPSLVVLDLALPFEDGISICQKIRARSTKTDLPILIMSAMANTSRVKAAFEAGADGFLAKPFDLDELIADITQLLSSQQQSASYASGSVTLRPGE